MMQHCAVTSVAEEMKGLKRPILGTDVLVQFIDQEPSPSKIGSFFMAKGK